MEPITGIGERLVSAVVLPAQDPDVRTKQVLPGFARGGESVIKSQKAFQEALRILVKLAGPSLAFSAC